MALMFLKMKTQMSIPKLMEELNGNIHYQMFCDILIDPTHPLTNYKLLDDIAAELAGSLKIQERRRSITPCVGSRPERRKRRSCTSSSAFMRRM